jgi:hypothetical protein
MSQVILPKELIAHIISFAPIVAPHSTCIKEIIQKYENDHEELETKIMTFAEFYFWNKNYEKYIYCIDENYEYFGLKWVWVNYNGEYVLITKEYYNFLMK